MRTYAVQGRFVMLLAVDIGNTSIYSGVFKGRGLKRPFRIDTYSKNIEHIYRNKLRPYSGAIEKIIVVSVVPKELKRVVKTLRHILGKKILVIGRDIDSGVKNKYRRPSQVGQDRLVNARAAYELYGGGAIIVDFGTAITIDVVNKKREYLGGVIAPGVETSYMTLSERAALLPKMRIKRPKGVLGRDTHSSMISGAVYGFSSLCDGIVKRLKDEYCKGAKVIATGGLSSLMGPYCETIDRIDPELTLKGLKIIGEGDV